MARDSERLIVTIVSEAAARGLPPPRGRTRPRGGRRAAAPPSTAWPPVPPTAAPAAAPTPTVVAAGPPIDRLFRAMAGAGASDLHLTVGMPPLIRKDGRIQPLETGVAALDPVPSGAAPADHSRQERQRVRRPSRYRLRLRDRRAGPVPLQRLHGSQRAGRRLPRHSEQDPHRRAARPLAAHSAAVRIVEGPRPRDRADRFGQVDDALRDGRLDQPEA